MNRLAYWTRPILLMLLMSCAGCSGCKDGGQLVKVPANDPKPPALRWNVVNTATNVVTYNATGTITMQPGDSFFVVLFADNPGGVQMVSIEGEQQAQCRNNGGGEHLAQNKSALYAPSTTNSSFAPGYGCTELFALMSFHQGLCDSPDFPITFSDTVQLNGTATNFSNIQSTSTLSFILSQ